MAALISVIVALSMAIAATSVVLEIPIRGSEQISQCSQLINIPTDFYNLKVERRCSHKLVHANIELDFSFQLVFLSLILIYTIWT